MEKNSTIANFKNSAISSWRFSRKVGFRYLRAKKSSAFLSLITAISIGGVGIGVLTIIVTLSVMKGFDQEMKDKLFAADVHVLIEPEAGFISNATEVSEKIRLFGRDDVKTVYPILQSEVILKADMKVSGALLKGIEEEQMQWLRAQLIPSEALKSSSAESEDTAEVFLGQELALSLGASEGDLITALSPLQSQGPLGAVPLAKKFRVKGLYRTGVPEQELHVVFTPKKNMESFLRRAGIVSAFEIRTSTVEAAQDTAQRLRSVLGNSFRVRSWQDLNAHLFYSLTLERTAMFFILIFIIVVASFNIISMLTMVVLEKRKSLSILRAMGATRQQTAAIFLWEGVAIGLIGVLGGTGIALGICYFLKNYPILELPDVFYDRSLPVVMDPLLIFLTAFVALSIVLIAGIIPAKKAAQLTPIDGIRNS